MAVFAAVAGVLAGRVGEMLLIGVGFALMGAGIALLATAQTKVLVFAFVTLLALGMVLITPNLSVLVCRRGGDGRVGASLGIQSSASSLGQSVGPLLGGLLFLWHPNAPYLLSGAALVALAFRIGWSLVAQRRAAGSAS